MWLGVMTSPAVDAVFQWRVVGVIGRSGACAVRAAAAVCRVASATATTRFQRTADLTVRGRATKHRAASRTLAPVSHHSCTGLKPYSGARHVDFCDV